jgi:hypothetical protein
MQCKPLEAGESNDIKEEKRAATIHVGWQEQQHRPATRSGKVVKAVVGGKLHRRGEKTHFPHEL